MEVRPYRAADADRAVAFLAGAARRDGTLVPPTAAEWHVFTSQSFNHGARDFRIAEDAGHVVGLMLSRRGDEQGRALRGFRIFVEPLRRREGIGAELYAELLAQDDDEVTLECDAPDDWDAGCAFLSERGFRPVRSCHFLRSDVPPGADEPTRRDLREYEGTIEEDASWRALHDEGYAGGPDYAPLTPDDLIALKSEPGFALHLAREDGAIVGLCHVKDFGGEPWINSVVTARAARGRGVARALLLRAMRAETRRPVRLSVLESNETARRLYRSLGFALERSETTWWREPEPA